MTKYKLNSETKERLTSFLEPCLLAKELLEKEELDTEEINSVLSVLGKFPAAIVYPLIEDLKVSLNPVDDGGAK